MLIAGSPARASRISSMAARMSSAQGSDEPIVASDDDLLARLGASDELGQPRLRLAYDGHDPTAPFARSWI